MRGLPQAILDEGVQQLRFGGADLRGIDQRQNVAGLNLVSHGFGYVGQAARHSRRKMHDPGRVEKDFAVGPDRFDHRSLVDDVDIDSGFRRGLV